MYLNRYWQSVWWLKWNAATFSFGPWAWLASNNTPTNATKTSVSDVSCFTHLHGLLHRSRQRRDHSAPLIRRAMAPVEALPAAAMAAGEAAVALPGTSRSRAFPSRVLLVEHGQVHRRARGKTRKLRMHLSASGLVATWHRRGISNGTIFLTFLDIDILLDLVSIFPDIQISANIHGIQIYIRSGKKKAVSIKPRTWVN